MRLLIGIPVLIVLAILISVRWLFWLPHNPYHGPRTSVEIDQLSQAMAGYKQTRTAYPPSFAEADLSTRKVRFLEHLESAYTNSSYGDDVAAFDALNQKIQSGYNFRRANGELAALHLEKLDAAESLVFWLGGFPVPHDRQTKRPLIERKLFGFHRDEDDPFKRDLNFEKSHPMQYRTDPLFSFDETRLVDNDHDGWWEYAQLVNRNRDVQPPYVYFDAAAYLPMTLSRSLLGTCFYPREPALAAKWGTIAPYLVTFDPQMPGRSVWANKQGIQIVCAGQDAHYGPIGESQNMAAQRLIVFAESPLSYTAEDGFREPHGLDGAESDNLTNLSNRTIGSGLHTSSQ